MKTVDLLGLDASSPSVLFSTLQPHIESPKELELMVVFLQGTSVVGLAVSACPISWVDVVEDLPAVSEVHNADSVVLILWGMKADENLPEATQVAEVIGCLQTSIKPLVKDVFFSDGLRYWSYMCQGCCDPEGKLIVTAHVLDEATAAHAEDAAEAWRMLLVLAELSEDHEDAERHLAGLCELVQNVKVRDSLLCHIARSEGTEGLLVTCVSRAINYATEAQMPRVAGMVAALRAAYDHPVKDVKQALQKAGDDSLAALVRKGIASKVPSSLYRRIFTEAAQKLAIAS